MSLVSIVVPVYHNAASLPDLLVKFQEVANRNPDDEFEFIFVNDGSKDNSLEVLYQLHRTEPRMQVLSLSRNFGSNPAIMAGLSVANGQAIAAIAADLQDPPELIHDMLQIWRDGSKVVLAARKEREDPGLTSFMADIFYKLFRRFAISTMPERGFDFFLIDQQVCHHINTFQERNTYLMGLILWLGFSPYVLYYNRREREKRYGQSMWTVAKKIKYFIDSFVAFSYLPVRLASILGILLSTLGFIYAFVIILLRIFGNIEIEGWTSLMIVLLLAVGAQMLMTGILGEYLWRNLDETRKRPPFIIEHKTKSPHDHQET